MHLCSPLWRVPEQAATAGRFGHLVELLPLVVLISGTYDPIRMWRETSTDSRKPDESVPDDKRQKCKVNARIGLNPKVCQRFQQANSLIKQHYKIRPIFRENAHLLISACYAKNVPVKQGHYQARGSTSGM
jgi:hypothetical protein